MAWKIEFAKSGEKSFDKVNEKDQKRIIQYLEDKPLQNPRGYGKALKTSSKSVKLWSYRLGKYRIIAEIQDAKLIILVIRVGKRELVYRN